MKCVEFFQQDAGNIELCKELQKLSEDVQIVWESESASPDSPGIVEDAEILARQVLDPAFYDQATGEPKPTLFEHASSVGASVNRLLHTTSDQVHEHGKARALERSDPGKPKTYVGYVTVNAGEVRRVVTGGNAIGRRRGFGIYDTALPNDTSHADVCQLVSDRAQGRSVRLQLFELAKSSKLERP
jgi:hypothetical protein